MSLNNDEARWQYFVKTGHTIHAMHGVIRTEKASIALGVLKDLRKSDFIAKDIDRILQVDELLPRIAAYLEVDPAIMQNAVTARFQALHYKAGLTGEEWKPCVYDVKKNGSQVGFTCVLYSGTPRETRYFIKTHQDGPISDNKKSMKFPDLKEVFIYKLLQYIGIGPEADFVYPAHGSQSALYIVTKDAKLLLLAHLTTDTACMTALLQINLISRILCLNDCSTNCWNCGQVGDKPMIVDFRIDTSSGGYWQSDILDKFYNGNGEFIYDKLMEEAVLTSNDFKLSVVKRSMLEWNLLVNIDNAFAESASFKTEATACGIKFVDDLSKYVEDIKKTIKVLLDAVQ